MSLPQSSTIEMHHHGGPGDPGMIVRHPTVLEATQPGLEPKPQGPFAMIESSTRGHLIAMIGEYIGTTMFLFFGYVAAQTANQKNDITLRAPVGSIAAAPGPSLIQISYISSIFGLSLMANVFVWYRVSGGMFNPSISFGLWLAGAFNWVRLVCVIPMQVLGAITAAGIVSSIVPGPLQAENSVGTGVTVGQGFAMEAVLTAMLMITILMLAVEKSKVSFMAPMGIGIALLIIHLVGINVSGASVNPARTLGVAIVNQNYVPEIWIYIVAPTLGATFMAGVHALLKALAYQTGNGGQDSDGREYYRVVPPSSGPTPSPSLIDTISYPRPIRQRYKEDDERVLLREVGLDDSRKY